MSDYDAGIWGVFVDIRTDPQMGATAMIGLRFDPAVPLTLVLMPFAMR